MIVINDKITIEDSEYELSFSRSSGPGGQNVNKVASKVHLHWNLEQNRSLSEAVIVRIKKAYANRVNNENKLVIQSDQFRDQPKNIEDCKSKLIEIIESCLKPPKKRIPTKPSKKQKQARLDAKKKQSDKKSFRSWKPD